MRSVKPCIERAASVKLHQPVLQRGIGKKSVDRRSTVTSSIGHQASSSESADGQLLRVESFEADQDLDTVPVLSDVARMMITKENRAMSRGSTRSTNVCSPLSTSYRANAVANDTEIISSSLVKIARKSDVAALHSDAESRMKVVDKSYEIIDIAEACTYAINCGSGSKADNYLGASLATDVSIGATLSSDDNIGASLTSDGIVGAARTSDNLGASFTFDGNNKAGQCFVSAASLSNNISAMAVDVPGCVAATLHSVTHLNNAAATKKKKKTRKEQLDEWRNRKQLLSVDEKRITAVKTCAVALPSAVSQNADNPVLNKDAGKVAAEKILHQTLKPDRFPSAVRESVVPSEKAGAWGRVGSGAGTNVTASARVNARRSLSAAHRLAVVKRCVDSERRASSLGGIIEEASTHLVTALAGVKTFRGTGDYAPKPAGIVSHRSRKAMHKSSLIRSDKLKHAPAIRKNSASSSAAELVFNGYASKVDSSGANVRSCMKSAAALVNGHNQSSQDVYVKRTMRQLNNPNVSLATKSAVARVNVSKGVKLTTSRATNIVPARGSVTVKSRVLLASTRSVKLHDYLKLENAAVRSVGAVKRAVVDRESAAVIRSVGAVKRTAVDRESAAAVTSVDSVKRAAVSRENAASVRSRSAVKRTAVDRWRPAVRFGPRTLLSDDDVVTRLRASKPWSYEVGRVVTPGCSHIKRRKMNEHLTQWRTADRSCEDVNKSDVAGLRKGMVGGRSIVGKQFFETGSEKTYGADEGMSKTIGGEAWAVRISRNKRMTPVWRTDEIMRDNLNRWLTARGKSLTTYRHMCCFGLKQSDAVNTTHISHSAKQLSSVHSTLAFNKHIKSTKPNEDKLKLNLSFSGSLSTHSAVADNTSKPVVIEREVEEPLRCTTESAERETSHTMQINHAEMLKECLSLMQTGFPAKQLLDWLDGVVERMPDIQRTAFYWTSRARLTAVSKQWNELSAALNIIDQAVNDSVQPVAELLSAREQLLSEGEQQQKLKQQKREQQERAVAAMYSRVAAEVQPSNAFKSSTTLYQVKRYVDESNLTHSLRKQRKSAKTNSAEILAHDAQRHALDMCGLALGKTFTPGSAAVLDTSTVLLTPHRKESTGFAALTASGGRRSMVAGSLVTTGGKGSMVAGSFVTPATKSLGGMVTPVRRSTRKSLARLPQALRDHHLMLEDLSNLSQLIDE